MPRTPLLTALLQLARDHARAEAAGSTPEMARVARQSRREFLTTMGAAAAGTALLGQTAIAAPSSLKSHKIVIVGGGISGLACALQLADKGLQSTIYESKGRVGGRMFSDMSGSYWNDGQVSEWCGELVDTGHTTMRALCKRFGLTLDDLHAAEPKSSTDTYFASGSWYTGIDADFAPVREALKIDLKAAGYPTHWDSNTAAGKALDQMSVYDWIASRVPGGHASKIGKILDVAYNIEYGAETKDQSSLNLLYLLGYQPNNNKMAIFGASDETYHIRGGNQKLPMAIASSLPANTVQFGHRMTKIAQNADKTFTLTFKTSAGKQIVTADAVVLALPFAVLRTLDYSAAGFDARKDMAIQQLGRGQNGKLMLQFKSRLWNQAGPWGKSTGTTFSDTGYQASWEVSRAQAGNSGILVDYTGGNATVDGYASQPSPYTRGNDATTAKLGQKALAMMEPVYPGLTAQANGKAVLSIPPKDTDFNCSYSYLRVGQYTAFGGHEKAAQGHCFFAGEHCSQDYQGFMEGAAQEGQRAANEVAAAWAIV